VAARDYGQYDGIAQALELVGERWALLIVRDLLVGPRRYGELAAGLPRIPSNILATRLKELQAAGVLRRVPHSRVLVYELTAYGRELEPVVLALGAWGFKALGDPREEQIVTPDSMTMALRTAFRPQVAADLPATAYAARLGPAELLIRVDGSTLDVTRGDGPADLAFAAGPALRRVISGELAPERAIATGVVEVLRGRGELLGRFASTFHLAAQPGRLHLLRAVRQAPPPPAGGPPPRPAWSPDARGTGTGPARPGDAGQGCGAPDGQVRRSARA